MKKLDGYLSQITSFLDGAYSQRYTDGYDKAKTLFGKHDNGLVYSCLYKRMKLGWSIEDALLTPSRKIVQA